MAIFSQIGLKWNLDNMILILYLGLYRREKIGGNESINSGTICC